MKLSWIVLLVQVKVMRVLMSFGMFIHRAGAPRPIEPSSRIRIPTRKSGKRKKAEIELLFYAPQSYSQKIFSLGQFDVSTGDGSNSYCAIINFHGGGFTLGQPSDDARWATTAVQSLGAVVISVGYCLAPEHPFPTAVENAVDALEWIINHAQQLHIDKSRIALSGFSAGGNICFAVLLAWRDKFQALAQITQPGSQELGSSTPLNTTVAKSKRQENSLSAILPAASSPVSNSPCTFSPVSALSSFYPPVDYTLTRARRRASNPGGASKSLPRFLTAMFDSSYLPSQSSSLCSRTPKHVSLANPYLSPARATDEALIEALPQDILLYTCEWDSLFVEGEGFRQRLKGLGKRVGGGKIEKAKHAWDKSPRALGKNAGRDKVYLEAIRLLSEVFDRKGKER